jgi:hypothetical protein
MGLPTLPYSHATQYESHVRVLGRLRNDRQQVPGHIDLPRPEPDRLIVSLGKECE